MRVERWEKIPGRDNRRGRLYIAEGKKGPSNPMNCNSTEIIFGSISHV